jgi:hypothetical protein
MPRIQRADVPEAVLRHLFQRRAERGITTLDLKQFAHWLDQSPTVPEGRWFKRFNGFILCGEGALVKTFLKSTQTAVGSEVE